MIENWNDFLCESVRTEDRDNIIKCLFEGANINHVDLSSGKTPLGIAVQAGRVKLLKYLLRKSADPNKVDGNGDTPISLAIRRDHLQAVKILLPKGISVNIKDSLGNTPLIYAVKEGKTNIVEFLINSKNANVSKCDSDGRTPLSHATRLGHLPIVKLLVAKGAHVNRLGPDGNTPLSTAVRFKYAEIVTFLTVIAEADVSKFGDKGKPPLSWAVLNEDLDLIGFLLENGAQPTIQVAFLEAVRMGNLEIVKLLNYDEFVFKDGGGALSNAIKEGGDEIATSLNKHKENNDINNDCDDNEDWEILVKPEFS